MQGAVLQAVTTGAAIFHATLLPGITVGVVVAALTCFPSPVEIRSQFRLGLRPSLPLCLSLSVPSVNHMNQPGWHKSAGMDEVEHRPWRSIFGGRTGLFQRWNRPRPAACLHGGAAYETQCRAKMWPRWALAVRGRHTGVVRSQCWSAPERQGGLEVRPRRSPRSTVRSCSTATGSPGEPPGCAARCHQPAQPKLSSRSATNCSARHVDAKTVRGISLELQQQPQAIPDGNEDLT